MLVDSLLCLLHARSDFSVPRVEATSMKGSECMPQIEAKYERVSEKV